MAEGKACIVGAGPSGLAAARTFKLLGVPYDQFEKHSDVGGIWDPANPGSPIYRTAHFISSKTMSGFTGFPMPNEFPDFPRHDQILSYVRSFASAYGLYGAIQFNTMVEHASLNSDDSWDVHLSTGEVRRYGYMVCANGHTWEPSMPEIPGMFDGEVLHSVEYRDASLFTDKRVLVVGAGNSGADIACDAASTAKAAFISMRRGYHFLPKHIFGKPTDVFLHSGPQLPIKLAQPFLTRITKIINGDITRYGLPAPDHKVLETHPLLNSQLLHYLAHGDLEVRGDIVRFDGDRVQFKDGTSEVMDLVLFATGYKYTVPYLDEGLFQWKGYKPQLAYYSFSPSHPTLFCTGFVELNSGGYFLYDRMAQIIGNAIQDHRSASPKVVELAGLKNQEIDYSGGIRFVHGSERMVNYADSVTYQKQVGALIKRMKWVEPQERDYVPANYAVAAE